MTTGLQAADGGYNVTISNVTSTTPLPVSIAAGSGSDVTVTGPLGNTQTPAASIAVVEPDELAISGSVTSATTLFTQDMSGYESATLTITANAGANTITFETSDDNTNWLGIAGLSANATGLSALTLTTATTSTPVMYVFPKKGRYFRARVSTYITGTTTVAGNLHKNPVTIGLAQATAAATTNIVGNVGQAPYNTNQTTLTATATGTTAATTATLTGQSGKTMYLSGFSIISAATAAANGTATVTGLLGGTMSWIQPTGTLTTGAQQLTVYFSPPLPASATGQAIAVVSAAAGSGGVISVNAWGWYQ